MPSYSVCSLRNEEVEGSYVPSYSASYSYDPYMVSILY